MNQLYPPFTDDQLHRWVDGRLDAEMAGRVEAAMAVNPELADTLRAWRAQRDALGNLERDLLAAPAPDAMRARVHQEAASAPAPQRPGAAGWRVAAVLAVCAAGVGFALGRLSAPAPTPSEGAGAVPAAAQASASAAPGFVRAAMRAHAVYVPEVRHPVEVAADDRNHLVAWLSRRLGAPVRAPDLTARGFELVGGRLLPDEAGPGAQFMYQDAGGERITLYLVRRDGPTDTDTAFRFEQAGPLQAFYWIEGGRGYTLSGTVPRERLAALATNVYEALDGTSR